MDIYEVALIILLYGVLLLFLIDTLFPKIYRGKLILSLGKERKTKRIGYSIMCIFLLVIWLVLFVAEHITRELPIFWIIYCILMLIRGNRPMEIRETAVYFDFSFHKFSKIISYTWKSDNILRIHYIKIFKQEDYFNLEINDKDTALKVDEVLQNYVNKI